MLERRRTAAPCGAFCGLALVTAFLGLACQTAIAADRDWSDRERRILVMLSLASSEVPPPVHPSNKFGDNKAAAEFGKMLFFDRRLSGNGEISCATCHEPDRYYTDGLARSRGAAEVMRNAPTVVGSAYQRWFYWDGRRDSLWSQALIPFEAADEMGGSRLAVLRTVGADARYLKIYRSIFGEFPVEVLDAGLPQHAGPYGDADTRENWSGLSLELQRTINRAYSNLGKAIAAFERTLLPNESRFDRYVASLSDASDSPTDAQLSDAEIAGAKLFMDADKTQCLQCHNGPMLMNGDFHNVGTGNFSGPNLDYGRVFGLRGALMDEFNCLGPYSDAKPLECTELRFLNRDSHVPLEGAFKVPSLRALRQTAPYFHDGRFATLREVLEYYNDPPKPEVSGPHELRPLGLTATELRQIEEFLLTFSD